MSIRIARLIGSVGLLVLVSQAHAQDKLTRHFDDGLGGTLRFDPPVIRELSFDAFAPVDYAKHFDRWEPWPGGPSKKGKPGLICLNPRYDEDGTLILGALYGMIRPDGVTITSADGQTTFKQGKDYKLEPRWGRVAGIDQRMGTPGQTPLKVTYKFATQRIDLVQMDGARNLSVKQGQPAMVCPQRPEPDQGHTAVAGVYIAPWQRDGQWQITKDDVYPIKAVEPVAPIGMEHMARTRAKLNAGESVRIAFIGDSITLGAEAGPWWDKDIAYTEKDQTYRGRLIYQLRQRFPKAKIEPIEAFKGGRGTPYGVQILDEVALPAKPDLILIMMGTNDSFSNIGGKPKTPVDEYQQALAAMVTKAKAAGAEVLLGVAMPVNPFQKNGQPERWPKYRQAVLDVAKAHGASVADVHTAWLNQAHQGVAPFSQLHNWINHPGPQGHKLFAETFLRNFTAAATNAAEPDAPPAAQLHPRLLDQPTEVPGNWTLEGDLNLPDADAIMQQPIPDRPVYGIYSWCNEYVDYHEAHRQVGWPSYRISGPMKDEAMKLIVQDGVEVMHTLSMPRIDGKNRKRTDYDSDEAFIAAYVEHIRSVLGRYGPNGSFFKDNPDLPHRPLLHVEILNEPNFHYMIPNREGAGWREMEAERFALYAKVLPAVYKAIKTDWPHVTVVAFGAGGSASADVRFIKTVHELNDEVAKSYDVISTHPYVYNCPPEAFAKRSWGQYSAPSNLAAIRAIMKQYGNEDKPVWYTEVGWRISKEDGGHYDQNPDDVVSAELQAAYIVRLYAMAVRMGVGRVHNMFITDSDNYNGGLIGRDGKLRTSGKAVEHIIDLMPHPKLLEVLHEADDGMYVYRFGGDSRLGADQVPLTMAWRVGGPKTITLDWEGDQAAVVDMLGNKQTVKLEDGKVTIEVGPLPVYVMH